MASVEALLAQQSEEVRTLAESLRALVRRHAPMATESANPGWVSISFRDRHVGYFCGLFLRRDDVRVVFEFGVLLHDPGGLFSERRSQVAWVDVRRLDEATAAGLGELIAEALALPASRDMRLAMVAARKTS